MQSLLSALNHLTLPHPGNNHQAKLRQPVGLFGLLIIVIAAQLWVRIFTIAQSSILGYATSITTEGILADTNQQRQLQGLSTLRLDPELSQAAAVKAQDMFARDYWAHVTPTGQPPWSFITQAGYQYLYAGENLARDFMESQSVVDAWMASPSHRDNLLSKNYDDIGIAIVNGNLAGSETTLVVQMFGTRKIITAKPPTVDQHAQATAPQSPPLANATLPTPVLAQQLSPEQFKTLVAKTPPPTDQLSFQLIPATIPFATPFTARKAISLAVALLLAGVLILDEVVMRHKHLGRIAGRTWAHFLFILSTIGMLILAQPGLIV